MRGLLLAGVMSIAGLGVSVAAHASSVSFAGDVDCFGLGGSCPDGTNWRDDLGGVFFTSNATGSDPAFTDSWDSFGPVSYSLAYGGGAATGASVEFRIAGVADSGRGPYTVFFNGTAIGTIAQNLDANAFQEVLTHSFVVPLGLLLANNTLSFTASDSGDGWSLDYVKLTVQGGVPEPATWALMIGGLALAGAALRRRPAIA